MKIAPVLTAILVAVALYFVVYERDRLSGPAAQTAQTEAETDSPTAETTTVSGNVAVVVLESTAEVTDNAVLLRGQTQAAREVEVKSEVSGLVISPPLRKGYAVSEGEVLCQVDPGIQPALLSEAEAKLAEVIIKDTAAAKLVERGFSSETSVLEAKAQLQAAQAAVELAQKEIDRLTIEAPFSGLLETDTAELGSLLQPGSICATILQLNPIKIVGFLPEIAINKVVPGAIARAQLVDGREIIGTVTFLSRSADANTRTFRVEIEANNSDLSVSDGLTADIAIASEGVKAHLIPASALTLNDQGTMGLRIVDENNIVQFRPVVVVRDTPDGILLTGLPDEARVIVVGQEFVVPGVEVSVSVLGSAS